MGVWDTAGQEGYEEMRRWVYFRSRTWMCSDKYKSNFRLMYPDTDLFLVVFRLDQKYQKSYVYPGPNLFSL